MTGLLVILTTAACSSPAPESATPGSFELSDVNIADYSGVTATLDFERGTARMPLDEFSTQSDSFQGKTSHALAATIDGCMVEQGFPAISGRINWANFGGREDRSFGLWSVGAAAAYGLDLNPELIDGNLDTLDLGIPYNKALPACVDRAKEQLVSELTFSETPNIDVRIAQTSLMRARESAAGIAAIERRSACLEENGVILGENDYPAEEYKGQGKETEVRVSVLEAQCAVSTDAIQDLFNLQARYQAAYMDQQEAALAEHQKKMREVEARLDKIIAAG